MSFTYKRRLLKKTNNQVLPILLGLCRVSFLTGAANDDNDDDDEIRPFYLPLVGKRGGR